MSVECSVEHLGQRGGQCRAPGTTWGSVQGTRDDVGVRNGLYGALRTKQESAWGTMDDPGVSVRHQKQGGGQHRTSKRT